jgi:hypothetical protein
VKIKGIKRGCIVSNLAFGSEKAYDHPRVYDLAIIIDLDLGLDLEHFTIDQDAKGRSETDAYEATTGGSRADETRDPLAPSVRSQKTLGFRSFHLSRLSLTSLDDFSESQRLHVKSVRSKCRYKRKDPRRRNFF